MDETLNQNDLFAPNDVLSVTATIFWTYAIHQFDICLFGNQSRWNLL